MAKTRNLFSKHKTTLLYKKSNSLITEGMFSVSRNPMYVGMFFLLLGMGICFGNIFSILTAGWFVVMIHFFCIPIEEKMMENTFGQVYLDYKQKVRRWLFTKK
jgi:protein-S-isoprenylcysteine O-methyltransferase Ste14